MERKSSILERKIKTPGRAGVQRIAERMRCGKWFPAIVFFMQAFLGTFSLSEDALTEVIWGYPAQIPLIKYIFPIFRNMQGWGIEQLFVFAGVCAVLYLVRDSALRKNRWLSGFSVFFGICMVFGQSYSEAGDWSYIFHGKLQFGLAFIVGAGYFVLMKNVVILLTLLLNKWNWRRNTARGRIEKLFFEKHPFLAPFLLFIVCTIPFWIGFFPGTIQFDGIEQLWCFFGGFPWTKKHPVAASWFMGKCIEMGKRFFHSDNMGYFFYTGSQALTQWLVFAYGLYVLCRLKAPIVIRAGALLYFAFFPQWQVWSATFVKDSYFYIFTFLLTVTALDIVRSGKPGLMQYLLLTAGAVGSVHFRHNGKYIVLLMAVYVLLFARKYWKPCVVSLIAVVLSVLVVDYVYIPHKGIGEGYIRETLSIPVQQTARYIKEHGEELTEEEREILNTFFGGRLDRLTEVYRPELSDPVKMLVVDYPTDEELRAYFGVWLQQFLKYPDTYIQAFLNQTYGYFYPDRKSLRDGLGHYNLTMYERWEDDYMTVYFASGVWGRGIRNFYEQTASLVGGMPVLSLLYSCGFHNLLLIGMTLYLIAGKRWRQLGILLPSLVTVLICFVSPVNAYIRYMLPVMALLPVNLAWVLYAGEGKVAKTC